MTEWMFWMNVGFVCRADPMCVCQRNEEQHGNRTRNENDRGRNIKKNTYGRAGHVWIVGCRTLTTEDGADATHVYQCEQMTLDAFGMPSMWVKIERPVRVSERLVEWKPAHNTRIICVVCVPMRRCIFQLKWSNKIGSRLRSKCFSIPFILSIDRDTETHLLNFSVTTLDRDSETAINGRLSSPARTRLTAHSKNKVRKSDLISYTFSGRRGYWMENRRRKRYRRMNGAFADESEWKWIMMHLREHHFSFRS